MAIKQRYVLDLVPNRMWVHVPCSQYDAQSRIIEFEIYNDNNSFTIPSGAQIFVHGTKKDGTGFEYQCSYADNVVQMVIEEQMTIFSGKVLCELRIVQGAQILGTSNFYLDVEVSPLSDDTVISETELPLLQEAIDASAIAVQSASDAQESANEALNILSSAYVHHQDVVISNATSGTFLDNMTYKFEIAWQGVTSDFFAYVANINGYDVTYGLYAETSADKVTLFFGTNPNNATMTVCVEKGVNV